ncbi:MAG TPA: adenylate/guanylate cyclase domain-containing protein [Geminicoccaceae bacterium]|nr:adenylate/guanylate cyclase domain-containing protein [Geminicoccus sp.]HMU49049.1 adenylate/guanylate cyclase domain-containing protein [Geminicoccaceae bacterium]
MLSFQSAPVAVRPRIDGLALPTHPRGATSAMLRRLLVPQGQPTTLDQRIAEALAKERQVSGRLGAHALTLAFCAIAVWCALVHPWPGAVYYLGIVAAFIGLAWAWGRRARQPVPSWLVLAFVLANAALLTVTLLAPNPLDPSSFPRQMALRPPSFAFFLLLIAWATFTLSPWLVIGAGLVVIATWSLGVGVLALRADTILGFGLPQGTTAADSVARYLAPYFVDSAAWASGTFVACLITGILAVIVGRMKRLVLVQARIERARANLARHVSANLVEDLAAVDEPFGPIRTQEVAVLFVDVVGFTGLCEGMAPEAVVTMLRGFHERMADCVFEHGGTLDKFMGDSVMATFGTPRPGPRDAADALACARSMLERLDHWNMARRAAGEPTLRAGIGLHFGPVVLGDIGDKRRVEFAVLGDTVNTASRLEALTRNLDVSLVASQALIDRVLVQLGKAAIRDMRRRASVTVRGRVQPIDVWTLSGGANHPSPSRTSLRPVPAGAGLGEPMLAGA